MKDIMIQINNEVKNNENIDIFLSIIESNSNEIGLKITTPLEQSNLIKDIIKYLTNNNITRIVENKEKQITKILHDLGLPSNMKGYRYIKDSINTIYNKSDIKSFTKELYPMIANKYNTQGKNVERAIRNAIDISWNRANWELMEEIFGYSIDQDKAKPTNKEYIITIVEYLKQNI